MSELYAGFGRVNITPGLGIGLAGYYQPRFADGVLDELEINALALSCGGTRAVILTIDHCGIVKTVMDPIRQAVCDATGLPWECVYIHATHTHTAPFLNPNPTEPCEIEYHQLVKRKMTDAAVLALADLKPARMGYGTGQAPHVAFLRRYRMKDGSVRTNPGTDNPDILGPVGQVDEQVSVLRLDQTGGSSLVLVSFANHPDTVGGSKLSADWPGFVRRTVERVLDGTRCLCLNGIQGDVNHVNVHPRGGDCNGLHTDFDGVLRGYDHARYLGRVITGGVLQAYDKVCWTEPDRLRCGQRLVRVPSNVPDPAELPEARRLVALHEAGRDDEIPFTGMALTTVVADACRKLRLEHGPAYFDLPLTAVTLGPVALVGMPGEPFSAVGRAVKQVPGWAMVIPTCNTNAKEGYFPTEDAYLPGGYEAGSSNYRAGVAERLIEEAGKLLEELTKT